MEVRDFSKVFDGLPTWLDEDVSMMLEERYIEDGDYAWNASFRQANSFEEFVTDVCDLDLRLKEGEVKKFLSSLGCRLIFIGTFAGNVVIHQRRGFHRAVSHEVPIENERINVLCYAPKEIQEIIGNKPITVHDLYRYTGFFNAKNNLGALLGKLRESMVV
tara:strand:- start:13121 stop:13603 length:483 start_codon:yes stop_codon:yes gene_type:complete